MGKAKSFRQITIALGVVVVPVLVFLGCSGPQPLAKAIRSEDRQAFQTALSKSSNSPKQAFFAARAVETHRTVEQVAADDARISATKNPFNANRDPAAVSKGAVIYESMCMRCHGDDVRGGGPSMAPSHPTKDFHAFGKRFAVTLHGGAPKAWFRKINEGFGDTVNYPGGPSPAMPAFGDSLAREQIWLAITYLQSIDACAEKR